MKVYDNNCTSSLSFELPDYIETKLKLYQAKAKEWQSVERFRYADSQTGIKIHFVITDSAMFIRGHGFRELFKISI